MHGAATRDRELVVNYYNDLLAYTNLRPELEVGARLGKTRAVTPRRNSRLSDSGDLGVLPIVVALAAFSLAVLAYLS